MQGLKRVTGLPAVAAVVVFAAVVLPEAWAVRYLVGGSSGWSSNVNYTIWARGKHFYNGDWLFFVYDRNQMSVLEVNKTDYDNCTSDHPLHNWTTGAGREVIPLNVTRTYYFISGKGFCFGGMKVAIHVENPPSPPSSLPVTSGSPGLLSTLNGQVFMPAMFAVAALWDSILLLL